MSDNFDARRATPAEYAQERAAAIAAARRGRAAPPETQSSFDARTAEAKDYASSKQAIIAAARRRDR